MIISRLLLLHVGYQLLGTSPETLPYQESHWESPVHHTCLAISFLLNF